MQRIGFWSLEQPAPRSHACTQDSSAFDLSPSPRRDSGSRGTARSTSGWCSTCTSRSAGTGAAPSTSGQSFFLWRSGTTSRYQGADMGLCRMVGSLFCGEKNRPTQIRSPPSSLLVQLRMLAWSWLVCLFFMPELLVKAAARRAQLADKPYWRHLCAAGGAVNIAGGSSALGGFVLRDRVSLRHQVAFKFFSRLIQSLNNLCTLPHAACRAHDRQLHGLCAWTGGLAAIFERADPLARQHRRLPRRLLRGHANHV